MSDRGLPTVDVAPACPFVAFDDDRDARSTAPDHRHRCFAEPTPAPRALAHQDAYCLSSAFPVCPAFQDWARREAAAARPAPSASAEARPARDETPLPVAVPLPPLEREHRYTPAPGATPLPPRRPPARDWAAPPPWSGMDPDAADAGPAPAAPGAIPGWGTAAAPARGRDRDDGWASAGRGLAGSAADRLAGPDPDVPSASRPARAYIPGPDLEDVDDRDDAPAPLLPVRSAAPAPAYIPGARRPAAREPMAPAHDRDAARSHPLEPVELFGPAWERPRRYEAYPSLRTRVGLPSLGGVPRLGVAAVALVIAALFLFFVGPMLLGLGGKSTPVGGGGAANASANPAPTVIDSSVPTVTPPPTPFVYTVAKGDLISTIAQRYGITVNQLLAANPQIKNPNKIAIGDQITIPVVSASPVSNSVSGASPSP